MGLTNEDLLNFPSLKLGAKPEQKKKSEESDNPLSEKKSTMTEKLIRQKKSQRVVMEILFSLLDFLLRHIQPLSRQGSAMGAPMNKTAPRLLKNSPQAENDLNHSNVRDNLVRTLNMVSAKKNGRGVPCGSPFGEQWTDGSHLQSHNFESVLESGLLRRLSIFLANYGGHFKDFTVLTLDVLRTLAADARLAREICRQRILVTILELLDSKNLSSRRVEVSLGFEVLWNCLSRVGDKALTCLNSEEHLNKVVNLFKAVLSRACKLEDKCLRNELMILLCYLLDRPAMSQFGADKLILIPGEWRSFESFISTSPGLHELLFYFATCDQNPNRAGDYFDSSQEDIQFKLLVLHSVGIVIKNSNDQPFIAALISRTSFVKALLEYVSSSKSKKFSTPQKQEIEGEVLRLLAGVIQFVHEEFQRIDGSTHLLRFMLLDSTQKSRILCLKIFLALAEIQEPNSALKKKIGSKTNITVSNEKFSNFKSKASKIFKMKTKMLGGSEIEILGDKDLKEEKDLIETDSLDRTLMDHLLQNLSSDIDLNSLANIGRD